MSKESISSGTVHRIPADLQGALVSDKKALAIWEGLTPHFTPAEIVDLTLLIGAINAWNRFGIGFRNMPA